MECESDWFGELNEMYEIFISHFHIIYPQPYLSSSQNKHGYCELVQMLLE